MEKLINKIEKKYGGFEGAAKALGITTRHLHRAKKGENVSETLKILIRKLAESA
jgi:hypothetical protein